MNKLKNLKLAWRIGMGFAVAILITVLLGSVIVFDHMQDMIREAERKELSRLFDSAKGELKAQARMAETLAALVANIPQARQAFAEDKRQVLADMFVPAFKKLKSDYLFKQFQFHQPNAHSYLRVHKPQKFGDDLSSFRKTVVETNRQRKPIQGIEKGVAGLGVRGVYPVSSPDEKAIGSVEFGLALNDRFFNQFKETFGVDAALYVQREGQMKYFAGSFEDQVVENDFLSAGLKTTQTTHGELNGVPVAIYAGNILDFSGKAIGTMVLALDRSYYVDQIAAAKLKVLFIGLIALIAGGVIAWLVAQAITRPLASVVDAMNEIAQGEGDLTRTIESQGNNEIGHLVNAFNQFVKKIQKLVSEVGSEIERMSTTVGNVSGIVDQTRDGSLQQREQTEQVATAITEMTATVQEVAANASQAADSAQQADSNAREGQSVVENTIGSINALASEIETGANVIHELEKDTEAIGSVLDVIRGIAEQTNLLALNAAIEAARAGEQGRGFAVVADEVRTLASKTQESTTEIQEMIDSLQSQARAAVQAITQGQEKTTVSVSNASDAGNALHAIADSVATISSMNFQIASAAEEQRSVSEEINHNVVNISQVAEQNASAAENLAQASQDLDQLAGSLRSLISQFKY
jgi:methyl-accepting chemotaxis protein